MACPGGPADNEASHDSADQLIPVRRYAELYEKLRDGVAAVDLDGAITDFNPSFQAMLGYPPEELRRLTYRDITPDRWHQLEAHILEEEVFRRGYSDPYEKEYRRKDGSVFPVELTTYLLRDDQDETVGMWAFVRDISTRRRAEEALRQGEEKYRTLAENIPVAVYRSVAAAPGKILSANPAMARMFGFESIETLAAVPVVRFYQDPEERDRLMEELHRDGKIEHFEVEFLKQDGSTFWGSVSARGIPGENGAIAYVDGIIADITDRRKAAEEVQHTLGNMRSTLEATVEAMAGIVEMKDPYTAGHQRRVADLAVVIAREMGLDRDVINALRFAGAIHDVGKISVPAEILSKPGQLTETEFALIRGHARSGYEILKSIDFPWPIARIVLQHHERVDGSGYPEGLRGPDILLEAKILSVADFVEAMASHRPYRPAFGIDRALSDLQSKCGEGFDRDAATACLRYFENNRIDLERWVPRATAPLSFTP